MLEDYLHGCNGVRSLSRGQGGTIVVLQIEEGVSTTVGLGPIGAAFIGEAEDRDLG